MNMKGSFFDATNRVNDGSRGKDGSPTGQPNPFLGIQFECCKTYGRIYRDASGMTYAGRCPKCLKKIEVPIGKGGSGSRFFRAS